MNAAVDPVALLRSVPNFSQLSDELVRDLATKMQHRRLRQGQVLIEEEPEEEEAIHQAGSDQDAVASPGLYYVVDGLLLATQRAQDRRAPVVFQVCDGGLIGATGHEAVGLMRVVAYRDTHLLSVDPDALGDLFKKWPELYAVVSTLGEVQQQMSWLTDCLRHSPILRHVPPRFLYELLTSAHSVIVDSHSRILEAGAEPQGLMVVLSGELFMVDKDDGLTTIRILERGAILGDLELLAARGSAYHVGGGLHGARVLMIPRARFLQLIAQSSTFRRSVLACDFGQASQRERLIQRASAQEKGPINLIAFTGDEPDLPLHNLVQHIAKATAREFEDRVLILQASETTDRPARPEKIAEEGRGEVSVVQIPASPDVLSHPGLKKEISRANYVFIETSRLSASHHRAWMLLAEKVVYIASKPYRTLPTELTGLLNRPLLYVAVVPHRPLPSGQEPQVPLASARISHKLIDWARRNPSENPTTRQQIGIDRLARAVTERRVGLALGGGGAFGYAHMPLIAAIHHANIPIDLVSGCSAGAVIGAYYATNGLDGLRRFQEVGRRFGHGLFPRSLFTSTTISTFIDTALGTPLLEDLELPFYPVVTDIDTATQEAVRYGTLGFGVRASGSFPGLFAPTTRRQGGRRPRIVRLVDGGIINNIPDDTLYLEGAQVVVASNVVPEPQSRRHTSASVVRRYQRVLGRIPGRLGTRLREVDPVIRLDDCLRSVYMMMHGVVDWESRMADAKFRAAPGTYAPTDWGRANEIIENQAEDPYIQGVVEVLKSCYRSLRWRDVTQADQAVAMYFLDDDEDD